jgi:hypothetical protein
MNMVLQQIHFLLRPVLWSKPTGTTACAGDLHRAYAALDADLRTYVRAFATPLVLIAALALAACFVPLG